MDFDSLSYAVQFGAAGAVALAFGLLSGLREHRERRRRNLDQISIVPWGLISVLFSILSVILIATAAKAWFHPAA